MTEPHHETSDSCWCLPQTKPLENADGSVDFIIVHNKITETPIEDNERSPMRARAELYFIRELPNKHHVWEFTLGDRVIVGHVVGHLITSYDIPITITVLSLDGSIVEIPWTSIDTITLEGDD